MAFVFTLLLVAITTVTIGVAIRFVDLGHVGAIYLVPVLISAMRWGLAPALLAATTSVAASAFFFYPPIYDFRVQDWEQLIDLVLFTIVAVVTSQLAVGLRRKVKLLTKQFRRLGCAPKQTTYSMRLLARYRMNCAHRFPRS